MPDKSRQFDFLSKKGFTPAEQADATKSAATGAIEDVVHNAKKKALMHHVANQIMDANSDEGIARRIDRNSSELAVHGYQPHQVEHITDSDNDIHPAAAHHHGDFTALWEPGHSTMYVYHKSQDRLDESKASHVATIPVGHLHKSGTHTPTVNQQALEDWHSNPDNVAKAMSSLDG
jgi:hypothetical protein